MPKVSHMVLHVSDINKSRDWYVNQLGFRLEREDKHAVGIKDDAGLTIFLMPATTPLSGAKMTFTIQVDDVESKYKKLSANGIQFASAPQRQFWGYGAEVLDPDGYINHLWDEVTMAKMMSEMKK